MDDEDFLNLMNDMMKYLETEKVFIQNPARYAEVQVAAKIAKNLFPDATITINDDPLQMGALILRIEDYDISVAGDGEIQLFQELISKADNFEIYPIGDERIKCALVFAGVLIRLPQDD